MRQEELGVHAYLTSAAGQQFLASVLRRHRLPGALDADLEAIVLSEAARTLATGGEIKVPVAWAKQRATSRAVDLVRGRVRRPVVGLAELADQPDRDDPDVASIGDGAPDHVRGRLMVMAAEAWIAAAGLAVLARVVDGAPLVPRCPQPKAGADGIDAAHWAGLWYAGLGALFAADGAASTRAMDQRRSRAARRVKAALVAAAGASDG
jgi:hypothetical protein